jgi:hypothetical protein
MRTILRYCHECDQPKTAWRIHSRNEEECPECGIVGLLDAFRDQDGQVHLVRPDIYERITGRRFAA